MGEGERAQSCDTICNVYSSWNLEPVVLTGLASKKKEGRRRRAIRAKKRRRKRPVGIVWGGQRPANAGEGDAARRSPVCLSLDARVECESRRGEHSEDGRLVYW